MRIPRAEVPNSADRRRLAYMLLTLERLLPFLKLFSRDTGYDSTCYLLLRDYAWNMLSGDLFGVVLKPHCDGKPPDTELFSHELTSHALNATLMIENIIAFLEDGCAEHMLAVSTLATDSVDLYLSTLTLSDCLYEVDDTSPDLQLLAKQEADRQIEDLEFVSALPANMGMIQVLSLRERANQHGTSIPL